MDDLHQRLFPRYANKIQNPKPIAAAFLHTLDRLQEIGAVQGLSEETVTAALFGGFSCSFPFCVGLFGDPTDNETRFCWGNYKKSRDRDHRQTEAHSGADFALVLWDSPEDAKIALFQAKKGESRRTSAAVLSANDEWEATEHDILPRCSFKRREFVVNLYGKPREHHGPEDSQLLRLVKTAGQITDRVRQSSCRNNIDGLETFGWVHYLSYLNDSTLQPDREDGDGRPETGVDKLICFPLSDLSRYRDRELKGITENKPVSSHIVDLSEVRATWFVDVLLSGLNPGPSPGWLSVPSRRLGSVLPDLYELAEVHIVDDKGGVGEAGITNDIQERQECTASDIARSLAERLPDPNAAKGVGNKHPPRPS